MTTQISDELLQENERLRQEVKELRRRLEEARETIDAIQPGKVDAVLVAGEREADFTLESAERPYRLVVERMTEGAATVTVEGVILYGNQRFADLLEQPLQTLIGRRLQSYATPESRPAMETLLRDGQAGNARAEVKLQRSDGPAISVYLGVSPLHEGAIGLCLMVTDWTQQRHYEELQRMQHTQARLAAIVESSDDAIISKDLNGIIMSWNRGAERIFGYTAQETIGQPVTMLMPPERVNEEPGILARLRRGESVDHYETVRRRKDGMLLDISLTVSPIVDPHGRVVGASKIARDITERKRHERLRAEQRQLLECVATNRPMKECLGALTESVARLQPGIRAAVLVTDADVFTMSDRFSVYLPPSLGEALRGRPIHELPIGIFATAIYTGQPITCTDIQHEESWSQPWKELCRTHGIRACHAQPILGHDGKAVASFFLCLSEPRQPDAWERQIADFGAHIAGIVLERDRTQVQLEAELAAARVLQTVSAELAQEQRPDVLYEKILDAAVAIMASDYGSIQTLQPARGLANGEDGLRLVATRGMNPETAKSWEWVGAESSCACAVALRSGRRIIVDDVERCDFISGSEDQATYLRAGIRAVVSTPLISRGGRIVGMISTHWSRPHQPSERDLRFLDILARQAADLIERQQAETQIGRNRQTFFELVERAPFGIYIVDSQFRIAHMNAGSQRGAFRNVRPVIGRDFAEAMRILWPEPVAAEIIAHFRHTLDTGEPYYSADFVNLRGDIETVEAYEWELHRVMLPNGQYGVICYYFDSTKLRQAERALRESEQRFREMIDALPTAIYTTDAQGRITHFNPAAVELSGRTPELGSDQWCVSWKLYWPDGTFLPHDQCPMAVALKEGRPIRGAELIAERPDGTRRWCEAYPTPMRGDDANIIGGINMLVDITERKQAQAAVVESEARFRQLADAMPQIVWTARPDGSLDYYNERWYEYTGFPRGEVGQASWEPILHPEDVTRCTETYFGCIKAGQPYQIEYRFKDRKTGGYRWFLGRALPVRDDTGRIVRWFGTCTDIDDTKRGEIRLRLLWEAAAVLLTTDHPEGMLRELFAKIGPHLGLDTYFNYMVNDSGDALRLDSCAGIPEQTARSIARLEFGEAISGTVALQPQPLHVTHIQRSDEPNAQLVKSFGIRAYVCNPLISGDRLLGTLSFASRTRDQLDADELKFLETLCHYVTVAYERMRLLNQLKEADRRKDEFLATLAHELRNPLAPVRSALQLLRLKGTDEPEVRWGRDVIDRQVTHLTRLIDDLLDVSRITRNKLELRTERVELADIIKGAVETSRPLIEQCGHTLTVSLPTEPVYLRADLVRLAQVFMNLLTNAAKYTERGGRIWLSAERQGHEIVVCVKDTGVGIPAEKLPRLFELFFQVDHTLARSQGGLGIGLSLVRRLVELHGGTVKADSAGPGKGSEFTVRLPVLADPPTPAPEQPTNDGAKRTTLRCRILVADDIRDSAESLAMLLRLMGNNVETAHDGLAAVEVAERFRPDIVFLDIGMPKLNGYDACRRIREQPWGQNMVLVALTGWGAEEDKRRTEEVGFNTHLIKPVDPGALQRLLATLEPIKS